MGKVYSASTGHISGAAYREKMVELMVRQRNTNG